MELNKKIIIISLIVVLFLVFGFVVYQYLIKDPGKTPETQTKAEKDGIEIMKSTPLAEKKLNKIETEFFESEKFNNLEYHPYSIPDIEDLKVGKKNPLELPREED